MSRIGKKPIPIPANTHIAVEGNTVVVKGPKGTLTRVVHNDLVRIAVENSAVHLYLNTESRSARALWGTYASHIMNMIEGVNTPFVKKLEIEGVGYRASVSGRTLELLVGFSHPVRLPIPEGIDVIVEKNLITISGIDKDAVGQFSATVRATKKPEPYKGKGIHYVGEYIIRKQGKKTA